MSSRSKPIPINKRPILVVSNSSWYLFHYRKLLFETLLNAGMHVVALSPVDSSSPSLSDILLHIPWRIHRNTDSNPFSLLISFLRMLFLVRAIKPQLVHSHTLKANLLTSIVTSFFGIPSVLSFAGMGRLARSKGLSRLVFVLILRSIVFFSMRQRCSRFVWKSSNYRTSFIFQNPNDLSLFEKYLPYVPASQMFLIPGSGVPESYFPDKKVSVLASLSHHHRWLSSPHFPSDSDPVCDVFFCGRLLRSKGIELFLEISRLTNHKFTVFGGIDTSSQDSLNDHDLSFSRTNYNNISFAGIKNDPLLSLKSDFPILVVPSNYGEGLPRAIAEALALGIPVICSKSSTCGIFDHRIVYIAEGDEPGHYLDCIQQLLVDFKIGNLPSRLQAGFLLARSRLSEESIVSQTLSLYNSYQRDIYGSYLLDKDDHRLQHWLAQ